MNSRSMRAEAVAACLILALVLASCGSSSTGGSGITPVSSPPLVSLSQAQRKLAFHLVLPTVVPTDAVLVGVGAAHQPPDVPATPAGANWAIAQYKWSKGRVGPWFYIFSIKETTYPTSPPPAQPSTTLSGGSTTTHSAPTQPGVAPIQSQATVTIGGVPITRTVTTLDHLGTSGNQKGTTTDYQWHDHGISFELTRYGDQISESEARRIISSMIQ